MDSAEIIKKLKTVKTDLQQKYGLQGLALFGSYSRNEQHEGSDIDLLIHLPSGSAEHYFSCAFALEDMFHPNKVEIVSMRALKPQYFEAIKPDLIYA